MSTFVTSKGTRGQHVSPKWQSRPYRPSPARREHIGGKLLGMNAPVPPNIILPMDDNRDPSARWFIVLAIVVAAIFAVQLLRGLL
jgi:hypothetical protein